MSGRCLDKIALLMPELSEESGQTALTWEEGNSKSNDISSLQPRYVEDHVGMHNT